MLTRHKLEDNYRDFSKLDAEELDLVFAIASQVKEKQDTKQIISDIKQGLDEHLEAITLKQQEGQMTTQELRRQPDRNERLRPKIHEASSAPPSGPPVIIDLTTPPDVIDLTASPDVIDLTSDMELSEVDLL